MWSVRRQEPGVTCQVGRLRPPRGLAGNWVAVSFIFRRRTTCVSSPCVRCLLKALGRLLGASETALGCSWVPLAGPGTALGRLLEGSWEALGGFQEASWTKDRNS